MSQSDVRPKVTVIVPTFNRTQFLPQCLDSLLRQTLPPHQIVLVNDGSEEDLTSVLKPYINKIEFTKIPNQGKSAAINHALGITDGDYVWVFDDDDVALPDALERFTDPLEKDGDLGYSFSKYYFTETLPNSTQLGAPHDEAYIPDLEERGPLIPLLEGNYLGGAALFVRSECYAQVGHYDPRLIRSQDYEMGIRITRQFKGVQLHGSPTFHYRSHAGLRGASKDRFKVEMKLLKWLEYDQLFFKELFNELKMSDYLPPDADTASNLRQAHLQRLAVFAQKHLIDECILDLKWLAQCEEEAELNDLEIWLIKRRILKPTFHAQSTIWENARVIDALETHHKKSPLLKLISKRLKKQQSRPGIAKRLRKKIKTRTSHFNK